MEDFDIALGGHRLRGSAAGQGPALLLCLHGYGNDRSLFRFLVPRLPGHVRMVALDLPFFGESTWTEDGERPGPADLQALLRHLLERYPDTERLHLLGFSLGAKVAIGIFQHSPHPIGHCLLIAPDGLRIHPLYRFCIYNPIGRPLFKLAIRQPGFLLFVLRMLYNLKIADAFKYRFVKQQFERPERRALLRRVWLGYSDIRPDLDLVAARSREWSSKWLVIWGKADSILPPKLGRQFEAKVPGAVFHHIDGGHALLSAPKGELLTLIDETLKEL